MTLTLPPNPYEILGVLKDAKLPEIRSAHRKLVLKCHPDKVQDAALKLVKQDEFQKVQQAYELLSDDNRRSQYDDQVKLFELRKEMGRGVPTARSNPFEYEIRTAEPRPSTHKTKSTPAATPTPSANVYERPAPRSYEDLYHDQPRPTARASKSQEYERKRPSARDEEKERIRRERKEDEERVKWEKEVKRAAHGEKSKKRDKERKRGAEEKHSSRTMPAYVEDEDSDDAYIASSRPRSSDKKMKQRMEEEIRLREEAARAAEKARKEESERTRKMNDHKDFAAQYMQAARRKVQPAQEEFEPRPIRRAETFAAPSPAYSIRYAAPPNPAPAQYSDEESPRRSSARSSSRRASETPQSSGRSREVPKTSSKESRRSPPTHTRDTFIVEPPSPPPVIKKPSLQTHSSAPPVINSSHSRKEPMRSQTMQSPYRKESVVPPSLPRAATFQSTGDHGRSGSRLKQKLEFSSDDSDSDSPVYATTKVRTPSPPRHRHAAPEPTRYIIDNGRTVPVRSHRSELREDNYVDTRDRSESPHGGRHSSDRARPPLARNNGSGGSHSRQAPRASSHSQAYYAPDPAEPVILTARPKMPPRESQSSYRSSSVKVPTASYDSAKVKYAPSYGPEHVVYTPHVPDQFRRGSDPTHRGYDSYPNVRGERVGLYA